MKAMNNKNNRKLLLIALGTVLTAMNPAWAESDMEIQEKALKARELTRSGGVDHSAHIAADESAGKFRGVFYGYLPCHDPDCSGIKMTLSLNAKNKYLLVIQPAKPQNRESFEKGTYDWDDKKGTLTLTPYKAEASPRRLSIRDESVLLYISDDGAHMTGEQDRYLMKKTEVANNREMHIH